MATFELAKKQIEVTGAICRMVREDNLRQALTHWCKTNGKEELTTRLASVTENWNQEKFECQHIRANSLALVQQWEEAKLDDFAKTFESYMPRAQSASMNQLVSQFQIPRGPAIPNVPQMSTIVQSAEAFNKLLSERIQMNKSVYVHGLWFMPQYANGEIVKEQWVVLVQ